MPLSKKRDRVKRATVELMALRDACFRYNIPWLDLSIRVDRIMRGYSG